MFVGAPACGDLMILLIEMSPVTSLILDSPLAVALPSLFLPSLLNGSRASAKHLRLPPFKLHYSMLAEDAIKSAVKNYKKNKAFSDPAVIFRLGRSSQVVVGRLFVSGIQETSRRMKTWVVPLRTFPCVETIGEIEKKELASIGDLHTYLSKLTDKLGSCSDYGLYTDFEKMAGIQKKEGVGCRSSHLHIQGQ
ncbi:LOW QUALITY PROTEIN: hypothetical protein HID58_046515 [Brassica napus]|uniref:Uncharacterized protein n=1 Tax=Brassica napus TaxID=3708 RepID=A0ABQ8AXE1_BRANA|nr:LOW QUALITY PROTEIN: hypothetical protein HID58_046515 [Brassica napus]